MLRKNFPGRRHQRRQSALERLETSLSSLQATPTKKEDERKKRRMKNLKTAIDNTRTKM